MIEALPTPRGRTARDRRRALLRESDASLGERLFVLARSLREGGALRYAAMATEAGLPLGEVVASPFAVRMVAMAVSRGAATVPHETRRLFAWDPSFASEDGTVDPDHGRWERGRLLVGKYQQFCQDEPLAVYNPDHPSKWGPHELAHRAVGFLYRPDLTRWELYLGSRLNELVPVVTWYGPEQAMRLDEGPFDRVHAGLHPGARLEDARWLVVDEKELRRRARAAAPILREGLAHFERELEAIDEELATGRRVRIPHAFLDASSDAIAYVAAHHARLRSEPLVETFGALHRPGVDHATTVAAYRDHVETFFDSLLFEPTPIDLDEAARLATARVAVDLVQRAAHRGPRTFAKVRPHLDAASRLVRSCRSGRRGDLRRLRTRLAEALGKEASLVLSNGAGSALALGQLVEGLETVAPRTLAWLGSDEAAERVRGFAGSEASRSRGDLAGRFARFLSAEGAPASVADLARFEASLAVRRRPDDRVERLSEPEVLVEREPAEVLVVASEALSVEAFEHDVVAMHAAARVRRVKPEPTSVLVVAVSDGVSVLPVPVGVGDLLLRLRAEPVALDEFLTLLAHRLREPGDPAPEDVLSALLESTALALSPRLTPP
ncbi:MAG: hypothetical protein U0230_13290 [Polyangiales bacterium]